jgi:hypothetical protein
MKKINVSFDLIYGFALGIEAARIKDVHMLAIHLLVFRIFIEVK